MSDTKELSFLEHLDVLRGVLFKIIGVFSVLCVPAWFCAPYVMKRLLAYAAPAGFKLHYFSLMEPFFIQLKVMLTLAVFASHCILFMGVHCAGTYRTGTEKNPSSPVSEFFSCRCRSRFRNSADCAGHCPFFAFLSDGRHGAGHRNREFCIHDAAVRACLCSPVPVSGIAADPAFPRDRRSRLGPQTACRRARRDPDYCGGRDAAGCGQPAYGGGADLSPV